MENKIPQKSFDAQMHIIRDVHFDVDKYKVGELYVINQKDPGYLSVQGKTVAQLREVNEHELKFKVLALNYDSKTGNSYNTYSIGGLRFTIDYVTDRQIEIERLLTETEAAVYLMGEISKECAKDIIPEPNNGNPVLADKYKGDLSHFILPNSSACGEKYLYTDGSLQYIGQDDKAAYKNDDAFDRFMRSEPITVKMESDSEVDTNINRLNYICCIPGTKRGVSFIKDDGSFACEFFDKFKEGIKVNLRCEETEISFRTSPKNIAADENTISVRNGNGTIKIVLHKDSFYKVFNIIRFTS